MWRNLNFAAFFCLFGAVLGAYPDCSYDVCANGGLWGEWTTTAQCATPCGSCSKVLYTRKCASANIANCECVGNSTRYIPCNTKTCAYPSQRTCCIPYLPMLINGSMQCGPFPKDPLLSSESPCCPKGGFWSAWTGYARNSANTAWQRTRKCLSESAGCPCADPTENIQTSVKCPCKAMIDVTEYVTPPLKTFPINVIYDDAACTAKQELMHDNYYNGTMPCNHYLHFWMEFPYVALIRFSRPSNLSNWQEERVTNCVSAGELIVTFYCDLVSEYWRLDLNNEEVAGFNQINIIE